MTLEERERIFSNDYCIYTGSAADDTNYPSIWLFFDACPIWTDE